MVLGCSLVIGACQTLLVTPGARGVFWGQCCLLSSPRLSLVSQPGALPSPGPRVPCDPVICPQPYLGWLPCWGPSRVKRGRGRPDPGWRGREVLPSLPAGINPASLRGTRTGVWVGVSGSEASEALSRDPETLLGYSMVGCQRAMMANRLSFFFDFKGGYPPAPLSLWFPQEGWSRPRGQRPGLAVEGPPLEPPGPHIVLLLAGPSVALDTACSSSLMALHSAYQAIRSGECPCAIVGGINILLKPNTSVQFMKLGMLSPEGICKSFDEAGEWWARGTRGATAPALPPQSPWA